MRRLAATTVLILGVAAPALAGEVSVADLVADGGAYEGTVTVEGELVGDFQRRGDWVWVQLNGDAYAAMPIPEGGPLSGTNVGVAGRFPAAAFDAAGFERPGRYGVRGALVRVTGEWRYHDESRGGESYLTAESFDVLERERRFEEEMPWAVLIAGLALAALGGLITIRLRRT